MRRLKLCGWVMGLAWVGCAAPPAPAAHRAVDTEVGLLTPATSLEAARLGIAGWEIRAGAPGVQVTAIGADDRRLGSALMTLRARDGREGALLVVRAKLGQRGQLALAADGTVVENTLVDVPAAAVWFGAMSADLGGLAGAEVVPYGSGAECAYTVGGTVWTCGNAIAGAFTCATVVGCVGVVLSGPSCADGLWSSYECLFGSEPDAADDERTDEPGGRPDDRAAGSEDATDDAGWVPPADEESPWTDEGSDDTGWVPDDSGDDSDDGGWDDGSSDDTGWVPADDSESGSDDDWDWWGSDDGDSGDDYGGADDDDDGWEDDWSAGSPADDYGDSDSSWDDDAEDSSWSGHDDGGEDDYEGDYDDDWT